ncbi:MAG: Rid family hydrolase [bacterium]|nr:Rid family hydrolase [bacterium]
MISPETVHTDKAPKPRGPFVQARRSGNFLFIAGQRGIDPATGELTAPTIEARGRQTMENLKAIAGAAGAAMSDFLSTGVYVTDLKAHRPVVNALFEEYFGANPPTRTIVEVRALNEDDILEIEAVVSLPETSA